MSAHITAREVPIYLVAASLSENLHRGCQDHGFRWTDGEILRFGDDVRAAEIATLLRTENLLSVAHCYNQRQPMSRPANETDLYTEADFPWFTLLGKEMVYDPIQVIQSVEYLEYQSNEHPGWNDSQARKFLSALRRQCVRALPGMEFAVWGCPWVEKRDLNQRYISQADSPLALQSFEFAQKIRGERVNPGLRTVLADVRECLSRLDDKDGAYRVTVLGMVQKAIAQYDGQ